MEALPTATPVRSIAIIGAGVAGDVGCFFCFFFGGGRRYPKNMFGDDLIVFGVCVGEFGLFLVGFLRGDLIVLLCEVVFFSVWR